tara:strand:- start:886 stop:1011 length:126 start_codon:yes stop_codon:yes gene_type:complete
MISLENNGNTRSFSISSKKNNTRLELRYRLKKKNKDLFTVK